MSLSWNDYRRAEGNAIGDDMHEDFAICPGITKSGVTAYDIDDPSVEVKTCEIV